MRYGIQSGCSGSVCRCGPKLGERHRAADRLAVADDVEVRLAEVDDPLPVPVAMYASRMFHSSGTVQSSTGVPLGTSWTSSGIRRADRASVSRTPSPVMLRQIGKSSRMNSYMRSPLPRPRTAVDADAHRDVAVDAKSGYDAVALVDHDDLARPVDAERRVVPAHAARGVGRVELRDLVVRPRESSVEREEAVGAALGDVERSRFSARELDAEPAP